MTNLKITLHLDTSAILSVNPLDGLLAKLWFEELKESGRFNGDFHQRLPLLEYDKEGFYHISTPQFDVNGIEVRTYTKCFDMEMFRQLFPDAKINGSMLNEASGRFKSYLIPYELLNVDRVVFYLRGDKEKVVDLLSNLHFIGKKSSVGMGKIEKITVSETPEDYSIIKEGKLMRHIPADSRYAEKITDDDTGLAMMRLEHAYWEKTDKVPCIVSAQPNKGGVK